MGQGEVRVVVLEEFSYVVHVGVKGNAVKDELRQADFFINPVNCHVISEDLLE